MVGVALQQVALDALQGRFADLGPARVVEEHRGPVQGRKLAADGGQVEGHKGSSWERKKSDRLNYSPSLRCWIYTEILSRLRALRFRKSRRGEIVY